MRRVTKKKDTKGLQVRVAAMLYLPDDLKRRLKHHAVDTGREMSDIATEAIATYLDRAEKKH